MLVLEVRVERFLLSSSDQQSSETLSDEELASLALGADPHAPLDPDAVAWNGTWGAQWNTLPEWYMPNASAIGRGRGTKVVVISIIVGLLVIDAFGLCITSGFLSLA